MNSIQFPADSSQPFIFSKSEQDFRNSSPKASKELVTTQRTQKYLKIALMKLTSTARAMYCELSPNSLYALSRSKKLKAQMPKQQTMLSDAQLCLCT